MPQQNRSVSDFYNLVKLRNGRSLLKVDRVASRRELEELCLAGADLITLSVCENLTFLKQEGELELDERDLSLRDAVSLAQASPLPCGLELYPDTDLQRHWETLLTFDFLQFPLSMVQGAAFPSEELLLELRRQQMPVLYSQLELGSCMPVDYSFDFLRELDCQLAASFQLEIMADYENAWEDLLTIHPDYPDDCIQVEQIQHLSRNLPLFLSLNVNPQNIESISTAFPQAMGLTLIMGQDPYGSQHICSLETALAALKHMRIKQEKQA